MTGSPQDFGFSKALRLRQRREFDAVFAGRMVRNLGPLLLYSLPNELGHHRLGLVVSRRVGNAVVRNRIKRMLRESFRLSHHTWPGAYDLVVVARPHPPLPLTEYERLLGRGVEQSHRQWKKRKGPEEEPPEA